MSVVDEARKLLSMTRVDLEKLIQENGYPPFCYYCSKTVKIDEISAIFKREGQVRFACTRHYTDAVRGDPR